MKRLLTALLILTALSLLAACAPPAQPDPPRAAQEAPAEEAAVAEEAPPTGLARGILRVSHPLIFGGKESLDPHSPTRFAYANFLLQNRLVRLGENGAPSPDLALSWEANEEATTWTFNLREGMAFHDGRELTSADVAYSFEHILDPATEAPVASTLALIDSIDTPDDRTVVFTLAQPHADFPLLLTDFSARVIPEGSAETIGKTGIGTGPFKLEAFNPEGVSVFVANDDYWEGPPSLAGVELIAIADADARAQALQAGQIDMLPETTLAQAALFANNDNFVVQTFPSGQWIGLTMQTDAPPFDDVRVRKALRLAADRQAIVDLVVAGGGMVACDTPVAPQDAYRWNTDCPQDIEQARDLLAQAGYPDGLEVTLHTADTDPFMIPLAEVYQQQAAQAGITVNIQQTPADSYWNDVWLVEPFVGIWWRSRTADQFLNQVFRSDSRWNDTHWHRPDFDQLLDEARAELDFDARRALYHDAQRMLFEEGGAFVPLHISKSRIYAANVSGVEPVDLTEMPWRTITKSE